MTAALVVCQRLLLGFVGDEHVDETPRVDDGTKHLLYV